MRKKKPTQNKILKKDNPSRKKNSNVEQKPKFSEEKKIPPKQVLVQDKKNSGTRLLIVSALKNNACAKKKHVQVSRDLNCVTES